ncbi:hypothetical protein D3C85_580850 [compost metagenome]
MIECNVCDGEGVLISETCDGEDQYEDCWMCNGKREVEEGCSCAARSPFECCCGGYDDVDLDDWEDYE